MLNPSTAKSPAAICTEAVELVRRQIGPTTGFQSAFVVKALPRTRSGKVSRALIRDIAEARNSGALFEGEDPEVIEDFSNSLSLQGYFHSKWSTATNNGKV